MPLEDCVLIAMGKFNKVLEIDYENRCVVTQPCVTNLAITHAVQDKGFIMLQIHQVKLHVRLVEMLLKILAESTR